MNQGNDTLIRSSLKNNNPTKIILVGSGAIKDSYEPLKSALKLKPYIQLNGKYNEIYKSEVMHGLASAYFTYKTARDYFLSDLLNNKISGSNITQLINSFPPVRSIIANEFKNNLVIWEEIKSYLHSQDWNTTAIITTNWDETLWNDNEIKNLVQLHGRAKIAESLIMPTEFSLDELVFSKILTKLNQSHNKNTCEIQIPPDMQETLKNCTKGNNISELLKNAHFIAQNWFVEAKEIVFIGIAMNIYDAELNSVVFSGAKNNWESVTNWNTDPKSDSVIGALTLTNPESIIKLGRKNRLIQCFKRIYPCELN